MSFDTILLLGSAKLSKYFTGWHRYAHPTSPSFRVHPTGLLPKIMLTILWLSL